MNNAETKYNTFENNIRKTSVDIEMNHNKKNQKKNRMFLYYLAVLASVGGMLFGYDTGVISGAIIQLRSDPDKFGGVGGMNLTDFEQEMVVGIATAGAIVGSILSSLTNKSYGRRLTIMGSSVAFVSGAAVMGMAPNVEILLIGRLIVGISVGFASHTVPMYLAEVSPDDVRGLLVSLNNVSIVAGQVLASLVDCGFGLGKVEDGWRYMLGLGGVPGIVLFFGFMMFAISNFEGTRFLGVLVSITLAVAMSTNLLLLPSLLLEFEKALTTRSFSEPFFSLMDEEEDIELEELAIQQGLSPGKGDEQHEALKGQREQNN